MSYSTVNEILGKIVASVLRSTSDGLLARVEALFRQCAGQVARRRDELKRYEFMKLRGQL